MTKASTEEILLMLSTLWNNLGEGVNYFDSGLAQEIINNGEVRGREFMRFLKNRARFDLRHNRPHFFIVTSDGKNPCEVAEHLAGQGSSVDVYANSVMTHSNFFTTSGITYLIGVLFGDEFSDEERTGTNIRKKGSFRGWSAPPPETAYLSRLKISDELLKKMGLWRLVMMHDAIPDLSGAPSLLTLTCNGGQHLGARCGRPDVDYKRTDGFGFLVPTIDL